MYVASSIFGKKKIYIFDECCSFSHFTKVFFSPSFLRPRKKGTQNVGDVVDIITTVVPERIAKKSPLRLTEF